MKTQNSVRLVIVKDTVNYFPNHQSVKSCVFPAKLNDEKELEKAHNEANLMDAVAKVACDNGMNANDVQHIFPAMLRMLKSTSHWAK